MEEIIELLYNASLQEVSTNKPGNVGPSQIVSGVSYTNYCDAINNLQQFTLNYFSRNKDHQCEFSIGNYIFFAVKTMIDHPPHKNLLLGHILLYAPLIFALSELIRRKPHQEITWIQFWDEVGSVLQSTTPQDGVWLSRAIQISQAGGIKNPGNKPLESKYNFTDEAIEALILQDQKTMTDLFHESAEFDMISAQYCSSYEFCRSFIHSKLEPQNSKIASRNNQVLKIFLEILATVPDSLIYRKNGTDTALQIQNDARMIQQAGGVSTQEGQNKLSILNQRMLRAEGKLNPGTTADLTACILFLSNLFSIL